MMLTLFNLADRQGTAAIAPAVKADLKLSDTQLGLAMGFGFALFYALCGFPLARLAERKRRVRILAAALATFALFIGLMSGARNFGQFLLCRFGVGAGAAGFGPSGTSLLGDHYPPSRRAAAITIVWLGGPVGAMIGAVGGGWVAQNADWRWWCIGFAIPGLAVALLAWLTLREPPRGMSDPIAATGTAPPMTEVARFLLSKRSMRQLMIGGGLAALAMNGIGQFLARYLVTVFEIGTAEAGRILGVVGVSGMASGLALGGFGVGWAASKDERWFAWGPALALLLAAPLMLLGFRQDGLMMAVPIILAGHVALFVYFTPTLAVTANMVGADMRASTSFLMGGLVFGLIAVGIGPTLTGFLSDLFASRAFGGDFTVACPGGLAPAGSADAAAAACHAASRAGILSAMSVMSLIFAWAALHYLLAARHIRGDLAIHYSPKA
jgi:predicted MFS family arabinose efflux permease